LVEKNTFLYRKLFNINYQFLDLQDYVIFKLVVDDLNAHIFNEYITTEKPRLKLIKGIKVSRTAYLHDFGPVFEIAEPVLITIGDKTAKINRELNLTNLDPGLHILKIAGGGRKKIEIVKAPALDKIIALETGIDIQCFSIGGTDIIGQNINFKNSTATPRDFMKSNLYETKTRSSKEIASNNLVLTNLKRLSNGGNWKN